MTTPATRQQLFRDGSWSVSVKPHGGYLLRAAVERALNDAHPTRWR